MTRKAISESKKKGCPTCDGVDAKSCIRCQGKTRLCDWFFEEGVGFKHASHYLKEALDREL